MTTLINLTPHVLNVHGEGNILVVPPTAPPARVRMEILECGGLTTGTLDFRVPLFINKEVDVYDLPDPVDDTYYITSLMVAQAVRRPDVLSPGELVRDENGQPMGCKGLQRHL